MVVVVYDPVAPIISFNAVPRFWHKSDITAIFTEGNGMDMELAIDYIRGTLFIGVACLAVLIFWLIVLLLCKCKGRKKSRGICAGYPFAVDQGNRRTTSFLSPPRKLLKYRNMMIVAFYIIIGSGLSFMFKGSASVLEIFQNVDDAILSILNISYDIVTSLDDTNNLVDNTAVSMKEEVLDLVGEGICAAALSESDGNDSGSELYHSIDLQIDLVVETLEEFRGFTNGLNELRGIFTGDFDTWIVEIDKYLAIAKLYGKPLYLAGPILGFGFLFLIGTFLAWKGPIIPCYFTIQTWVTLPLAFLIVIIIGFFTSAIGTILVINSDICVAGDDRNPEAAVQAILRSVNDSASDHTIQAANYYLINQCQGEFSTKGELDAGTENLIMIRLSISHLIETLSSNQGSLENICGGVPGSLDPMKASLLRLRMGYYQLVTSAENLVRALDCERINTIVTDILYTDICRNIPYSLLWMFSALMFVFGFGMVALLCRGVLLPLTKVDRAPNSSSHGSSIVSNVVDNYNKEFVDDSISRREFCFEINANEEGVPIPVEVTTNVMEVPVALPVLECNDTMDIESMSSNQEELMVVVALHHPEPSAPPLLGHIHDDNISYS